MTAAESDIPLGIIAGGGKVPLIVAAAARMSGRRSVIFGLAGEAGREIETYPHHWIHWGEIGRLFDLLGREGIGALVIAGSVTRPDYRSIRVDLGALMNLPKILSLMIGGDDTILKNVVRFFEERGYKVIGAHEVAPALVAHEGLLGRILPSREALADSEIGLAAAVDLGRHDIGQAVVALGGRVIAVEGIEGTDALLERVGKLKAEGRLKSAPREGVLVKIAKPQQDLRIDMPVIGLATLEKVAQAGLEGIVVEAGRVMVLDRDPLIAAADRQKLFLKGISLAHSWTME